MNDSWLVYCDGSAFPNPGTMGLGAVLLAPDGRRHELSETAPGRGCNNEAEARAMMAALQQAKTLGAMRVQLNSDSRVVVDKLSGVGAENFARLDLLFHALRTLLASFEEVKVAWVPGHRNTEADALARTAAGLPVRPPLKPQKKVRLKLPVS